LSKSSEPQSGLDETESFIAGANVPDFVMFKTKDVYIEADVKDICTKHNAIMVVMQAGILFCPQYIIRDAPVERTLSRGQKNSEDLDFFREKVYYQKPIETALERPIWLPLQRLGSAGFVFDKRTLQSELQIINDAFYLDLLFQYKLLVVLVDILIFLVFFCMLFVQWFAIWLGFSIVMGIVFALLACCGIIRSSLSLSIVFKLSFHCLTPAILVSQIWTGNTFALLVFCGIWLTVVIRQIPQAFYVNQFPMPPQIPLAGQPQHIHQE